MRELTKCKCVKRRIWKMANRWDGSVTGMMYSHEVCNQVARFGHIFVDDEGTP